MTQITLDSSMATQNTENKENIVCPESTIDAAPRRDFIRKAALTAAGVAIGASVIGGNVLPKTSASTGKPDCGDDYFCNLFVGYSYYPDSSQICCGLDDYTGVIFGEFCSGERIRSQRRSNTCCNVDGLDFEAGGNKLLRIYNCGNVGINTHLSCCFVPGLTVNGNIGASSSILGINCGNGNPAIGGFSNYETCGGGVGAYGKSTKGVGVQAQSCKNLALSATTYVCSVVGKFENIALTGDKSALIQFETGDSTVAEWNAGVAGKCNALGVASGSFYVEQVGKDERLVIDSCGNIYPDPTSANAGKLYPGPSLIFGGPGSGEGIASNRHTCNPNQFGLDFYTDSPPTNQIAPRMSISQAGNVGVGTRTPALSFQIAGSFGAKLATVSSSYSMTAADFGILADAASGAVAVTLPPAKTAGGMVVFVKKSDSSSNVVTVKASGSDLIEGKSSEALTKEFTSLTLVSDGTSNWYRLANGA